MSNNNKLVINELSNEKIKIEELEQSAAGQLSKLSDEESNNVVGGYYAGYWNPYPNPWTPVIIGQTEAAQNLFAIQNEEFLAWLRS